MTLSSVPGVPGTAVPSRPPAHGVTWPQVTMTLGVLFFTGWMLTRGYEWYLALLIASCAVVVGTGLIYLPRGLMRLARAIDRQDQ
ncbi:hypothetical protein [Amycolatopsis sp. NPDC102389]|uniref:hypothetical protein n=1 Tax=Amycolatopsis sp. NPDC102389 TaxID=3363941 RepID=UPI003820A752